MASGKFRKPEHDRILLDAGLHANYLNPGVVGTVHHFFLARSCLGQVPGRAPFSQRSELATACTNRMQIKN